VAAPEPPREQPLVAVLDYGIGNLRSAQKALQRVGADARLTADAGLIRDAAGVVLPGVGAFGRCMTSLRDAGLEPLANEAMASGRPFLGVCIGMQMLFAGSEESPGVAGLGRFAGTIRLLPDGVKRPQMQWNRLRVRRPSPLLAGLDEGPWMYFVHSFAAEDSDATLATCEYGGDVVALVGEGNVAATQFHPEKSGANGLRLLANWVEALA
jgi:imidazole glycerol-phosphate synthase subunit HisH